VVFDGLIVFIENSESVYNLVWVSCRLEFVIFGAPRFEFFDNFFRVSSQGGFSLIAMLN